MASNIVAHPNSFKPKPPDQFHLTKKEFHEFESITQALDEGLEVLERYSRNKLELRSAGCGLSYMLRLVAKRSENLVGKIRERE